MQIIDAPNINEARTQINKLTKEKKQVIVKAQDIEFNRAILEIKGVNILLFPQAKFEKDSLKQRNSGLNEFLAKLAKKNNITIAIDLQKIIQLEKKQKARELSKIMQNILLCKKAKADMSLFPENQYNESYIKSFFNVLNSKNK